MHFSSAAVWLALDVTKSHCSCSTSMHRERIFVFKKSREQKKLIQFPMACFESGRRDSFPE
jgi:hypothetical protein